MTDRTGHWIEDGQAVCYEPEGTFCRMGCPTRTCESWSDDGCLCAEPLVDYGKCNAAEWVNADGLAETIADEDQDPTYSGPVRITWSGEVDAYQWEPA